MAPVRSYCNWNQRTSDTNEKIEPYRKYFFICEGANTETWYFESLIDNKKTLGINPNIDIRFLEKTDEDKDISFPRRLIEFAEEQKENPDISFDVEMDRMIIIFDADIFETKVNGYDEVLELGEKNNLIGISNPAFELFLLLHYQDAYEKYIKPHETDIISNQKVGNQRFIRALFTEVSGINPKKNKKVGELAKQIVCAITEESKINEDILKCSGRVTCNIAKIIDDIRNNKAI